MAEPADYIGAGQTATAAPPDKETAAFDRRPVGRPGRSLQSPRRVSGGSSGDDLTPAWLRKRPAVPLWFWEERPCFRNHRRRTCRDRQGAAPCLAPRELKTPNRHRFPVARRRGRRRHRGISLSRSANRRWVAEIDPQHLQPALPSSQGPEPDAGRAAGMFAGRLAGQAAALAADECLLGRGATWHKPIDFDDDQMERYGHTFGPVAQTTLSAVKFFATAPLVPYYMGVDPPGECIYDLGTYMPGDCCPYYLDPFPLSIRGAINEMYLGILPALNGSGRFPAELADANVPAGKMRDDFQLTAESLNQPLQCAQMHVILRFHAQQGRLLNAETRSDFFLGQSRRPTDLPTTASPPSFPSRELRTASKSGLILASNSAKFFAIRSNPPVPAQSSVHRTTDRQRESFGRRTVRHQSCRRQSTE